MEADYFPTKHLREKMAARNVTWAEIVDILDMPEVSFGPDFQGKRVLQKGDLAVVVGRDNAVITVLLRDADEWDDAQASSRSVSPVILERHSELIDLLKQYPNGATLSEMMQVLNFNRQNENVKAIRADDVLSQLKAMKMAFVVHEEMFSGAGSNPVWKLRQAYR